MREGSLSLVDMKMSASEPSAFSTVTSRWPSGSSCRGPYVCRRPNATGGVLHRSSVIHVGRMLSEGARLHPERPALVDGLAGEARGSACEGHALLDGLFGGTRLELSAVLLS